MLKKKKQYDAIGPPFFSPDSKRLAYGAKTGDKLFVVLDGKEEKQYDGILGGTPVFSPDSKRVAYGAKTGDKLFMVVDGKEEKQYDGILGGTPVFSPDSKRLAYGPKQVINGLSLWTGNRNNNTTPSLPREEERFYLTPPIVSITLLKKVIASIQYRRAKNKEIAKGWMMEARGNLSGQPF